MPLETGNHNGYCKGHTGLMEAVDHLKRTQRAREDTITRIWKAIESRITIRMFISILSATIAIFGMVIGALFYNQDHFLSSLLRSQEIISAKMGDVKLDIEIIKQRLKQRDCDKRE